MVTQTSAEGRQDIRCLWLVPTWYEKSQQMPEEFSLIWEEAGAWLGGGGGGGEALQQI